MVVAILEELHESGEHGDALDLAANDGLSRVDARLGDLFAERLLDDVPAGRIDEPEELGPADDGQHLAELHLELGGKLVDVFAPALVFQKLDQAENLADPYLWK